MASSAATSSSSLSLSSYLHRNFQASSYSRRSLPILTAARHPNRPRGGVSVNGKFDKFDAVDGPSFPPELQLEAEPLQESAEDQDSDLPSDLEDAIRQSGKASASFISSGGMRAMVELLIPQLQFLDAEGAQADLWQLSRIYLETLMEETGIQRVRAIFPDAGAAALLKYQWKDVSFGFSSLSDRKPVQDEDEIVVMIVPDYQMLEYVERIASQLSGDTPRPLIMWNPRLISEDVGVGFNVRKLRKYFLSYSIIKRFQVKYYSFVLYAVGPYDLEKAGCTEQARLTLRSGD